MILLICSPKKIPFFALNFVSTPIFCIKTVMGKTWINMKKLELRRDQKENTADFSIIFSVRKKVKLGRTLLGDSPKSMILSKGKKGKIKGIKDLRYLFARLNYIRSFIPFLNIALN